MASVLRASRAGLCGVRRGWLRQISTVLIAVALALVLGRAEAAPKATYRSTSGWEYLDAANGSPGGYDMNYEATIEVDGVYEGKTAYKRRRALNAAKLGGTLLTSALAGPVIGIAAEVVLDAGLSYLNGKLMKKGKPPAGGPTRTPYPQNLFYGMVGGGNQLYGGTPQEVCQAFVAASNANGSNLSYISAWVVAAGGICKIGFPAQPNSSPSEVPMSKYGGACIQGDTYQVSTGMCIPPGYVEPDPVPVTAGDAEAQAAINQAVNGLSQADLKGLAEYARSQGFDVTEITDFNGNTIAGPDTIPLPPKHISTVDPVTGLPVTTNVVDSVKVALNTDPATAEVDPLKLTQETVKTTEKTNADGSKTTTTETTTTGGTKNQSTDEKNKAEFGEFTGPDGELYKVKTKTFADVFGAFVNTIKGSAWYSSSVGFFNVSISGGQCPHWAMPANKWMPALDAGQFVCSETMVGLYRVGGAIVLIVAAWAAFRIAFL